jgi:hypothetical protein
MMSGASRFSADSLISNCMSVSVTQKSAESTVPANAGSEYAYVNTSKSDAFIRWVFVIAI